MPLSQGFRPWDVSDLSGAVLIRINEASLAGEPGEAVDALTNIAGGSYSFTPTSSKPTIGEPMNGLATLAFSGNDQFFIIENSETMLDGAECVWVAAVVLGNNVGGNYRYLTGQKFTNDLDLFSCFVNAEGNKDRAEVGGRSQASNAWSSVESSVSSANAWAVLVYKVSYVDAVGTVVTNGRTVSGNLSSMTKQALGAEPKRKMILGKNRADLPSQNALSGQLGEFILGTGELSAGEIEKLTGYLAWKWALQSTLAESHPYRYVPPTIVTDHPLEPLACALMPLAQPGGRHLSLAPPILNAGAHTLMPIAPPGGRAAALRLYGQPYRPPRGSGYLAGEFPDGLATKAGAPVSATVRVLCRATGKLDGAVVARTVSAADGTWRVDGLSPDYRYDVVGRLEDHNDVIVSNVVPAT